MWSMIVAACREKEATREMLQDSCNFSMTHYWHTMAMAHNLGTTGCWWMAACPNFTLLWWNLFWKQITFLEKPTWPCDKRSLEPLGAALLGKNKLTKDCPHQTKLSSTIPWLNSIKNDLVVLLSSYCTLSHMQRPHISRIINGPKKIPWWVPSLKGPIGTYGVKKSLKICSYYC